MPGESPGICFHSVLGTRYYFTCLAAARAMGLTFPVAVCAKSLPRSNSSVPRSSNSSACSTASSYFRLSSLRIWRPDRGANSSAASAHMPRPMNRKVTAMLAVLRSDG